MDFSKVRQALLQKGYAVEVYDTKEEATAHLTTAIQGTSVGIGGSVTVQQLGLYPALAQHNQVFWHWQLPAGSTAEEMRQAAREARVYLSSVNALAQTGEIVNIDGACNRIAEIFYGHTQVYLLVGQNKLAPTLQDALDRARNVAAPKNAKRLGLNTPCVATGRCSDCKSPQRICNGAGILLQKPTGADVCGVLIGEDLGY